MLTEIHFPFEFILRCVNWDFLRPFRTDSRQALPSKTADGSVAHKEGGDFEFLSGFSSKLKEFPRAMGWVSSGGKKRKTWGK